MQWESPSLLVRRHGSPALRGTVLLSLRHPGYGTKMFSPYGSITFLIAKLFDSDLIVLAGFWAPHAFPHTPTSKPSPSFAPNGSNADKGVKHDRPEKIIASPNPSPHSLLTKPSKPYSSYINPLKSSPELEKIYAQKTVKILSTLFPKTCNCEKPNLVHFKIKTRPTISRCTSCYKQISITANTPLQGFHLPLSYFSYIFEKQILAYPRSISSMEISRTLNLSYKSSYYLKRRIQIICSLLNDNLQKQMYDELKTHNENNPVKLPKNGDYREITKNNPVAVCDSVVLYSSSLKANKHRSRRYKTGTSSIFLSNALGGGQSGILVHTVGINHGMTFYKSIPLNNQEYLSKDLDSKIPKQTILYSDEGYTFLWDRINHRAVNHSKRSNDNRYNMSRERWITKQSVSSNGAEARNNVLKQSFRSFAYVSPKWSQCYLSEFSFLGNVRFSEPLRELFLGSIVGEGEKCWILPQEGIEPPLSVPKTDVLSVELPGQRR